MAKDRKCAGRVELSGGVYRVVGCERQHHVEQRGDQMVITACFDDDAEYE